jgi:hypothetical protein
MSSGSKHDGRPVSRKELEDVLSNPDVREALEEEFEIDTGHDLPYLAGYSNDGRVRYVDRHIGGDPDRIDPDELGIVEIDGKKIDIIPFLVGSAEAEEIEERGGHEGVEKAAEQFRSEKYTSQPPYAWRHEIATGAERRDVLAAGLSWAAYSKALEPYIKADDTERLQKVPEDLDMSPYLEEPVEKNLVDRMYISMDRDTDKYDKDEVDYSKGLPDAHCGICEHFEADRPHGCALVKGFIEAPEWCEKFEHKGDSDD